MNRNGLRLIYSIVVAGLLWISVPAWAGPYDFDDDERNDMRSAWLMCATTGFTLGECPSVFVKCWQPPLIYLQRHRSHYHVRTHCVRLPSWDTSDSAVDNALAYARANTPAAVAYQSGMDAANFSLTPQICIDAPYLCPTAAEEAAFHALEEAQESAQAEFDACVAAGGEGCVAPERIDETPPICFDNPDLCGDLIVEENEDEGDSDTVPDFTHPICEDNPQLCDDVMAGTR